MSAMREEKRRGKRFGAHPLEAGEEAGVPRERLPPHRAVAGDRSGGVGRRRAAWVGGPGLLLVFLAATRLGRSR